MRSIQSTLFTLLVASGAAHADTTFNLTPGVSPISRDIYALHMTIFWICVVIGVFVFGAMIYSMYHHRKSRGAKSAEFHSHPVLEVTWTIIPALILVLMAFPATKVLLNINNHDKDDITIKITGYQWKWHYEYLEDGVSFFSNLSTPFDQIHNKAPKSAHYLQEVDHPIVVPVHKKIRFLITSNDVNHAWWVPDLGVKRDAVSGFINEAWTIINKPGVYRGQCAELCGVNHAFMPIVVEAVSEQAYKDWVAKQKGEATGAEVDTLREWTLEELMKHGEEVYSRICAACHQPNGMGQAPMYPALKGDHIALGPVSEHIQVVMNGVSGTAMQAFKNQLSDVDLAAVITYERNAWGNNTGTYVQPIQLKAYRDGKTLEEALKVTPGALPSPATDAKKQEALPKPVAESIKAAESNAPASAEDAQPTKPATDVAATSTESSDSAANAQDDLKAAMVRGEKVYLSHCAACHQPNGAGMPPTFPALKGSAIATGPAEAHIKLVLGGKMGTAMVAFKDQLNDLEIADVITYERNAWENNTGSFIKPDDIKKARQGIK